MTKAIRDLGCTPGDCDEELERLVEETGELMDEDWTTIRTHADGALGIYRQKVQRWTVVGKPDGRQ